MQALSVLTSRLEEAGIPYCIVGGLAAIAYGRPRLTLDADLVIALAPHHLPALQKAFPIEEFYLPPTEVLLTEIARESRGHFNILDQTSAFRGDCYLPGTSELARWELAHRHRIETVLGTFWFSPPEAVIVHKLLFYREGGSTKHLEDIRGILSSMSANLRFAELTDWIDRLGVRSEWELVNAECGTEDRGQRTEDRGQRTD